MAQAQRPASAYIPLDDPAATIADALVVRGALPSLSALERPYRAHDVRVAVEAAMADSARARLVPSRWLGEVLRAAQRHDPAGAASDSTLHVSAELVPFVTAQSTGRRELMLADTAKGGAYPGADVRFALQSPAFVGVSRLRLDRAMRADPEFVGKSDRVIAARVEDAYLAARWRWAALDVGRVARNWGPAPLHGLQLGHYADSYDHLQLVLGVDRLHLTTIAARLDDRRIAPDTVAQRWFAAHRLAGRWRALEMAVAEAVVYGGPARGFDLMLANPFGFYDLAQYDEHKSLNVSYAVDVALRTKAHGTFAAQFLADDFQVDRCAVNCKEPPSFGGTLSVEGMPVPLPASAAAFGSYTRVDNLTYRTILPWERWESLGLGLARGQSDYDELRAGVELAPPYGGPLRIYGAFRRQGEGDFHAEFPLPIQYAKTPEIFAGVVERVRRVGAQWSTSGRLSFSGDVGWQSTSNADHVPGRTRSGFEGRVKLSLTPALGFSRTVSD
ncbi:MAG: hypothetical protein HOQ12_02655 [Gemmatimonadaceae bacterium]|nr:hypothetical protein [Gemmatimonadaceae bacterium]NUQ93663.1 hypothetical protein [Gemmatimonadaceae bacterium]NUR18412.1 hypothetical protein [Gemmatimonadaceae bacterium]